MKPLTGVATWLGPEGQTYERLVLYDFVGIME